MARGKSPAQSPKKAQSPGVQKKKAVNFGKSPNAQSPGAASPSGGALVSPLIKNVEVEEEPLPEQPALFIPTASPTLLIEQSPYHEFLRDFGMSYNFPERLPKCIICVSARWVSDTDQVKVMSNPYPQTVHDFFGFADCLYAVEYAAQCPSEHSAKVAESLEAFAIPWEFDGVRGYDFGCWSPLALIFPGAEIPVVQVSLAKSKDSIFHSRLGRALGELRDEGYLLLCTGGVTMGLMDISFGDSPPAPSAVAFDQWVYEVLLYEENKDDHDTADSAWAARTHRLTSWNLPVEGVHNAAKSCHPTGDHILPLIVASASGGPSKQLHTSWMYNALSMRSYIFGQVPPRKTRGGVVMDATPTSSPLRSGALTSPDGVSPPVASPAHTKEQRFKRTAGVDDVAKRGEEEEEEEEEELDEIEFGIVASNTKANVEGGFAKKVVEASDPSDRDLKQVMLALEGASRASSAVSRTVPDADARGAGNTVLVSEGAEESRQQPLSTDEERNLATLPSPANIQAWDAPDGVHMPGSAAQTSQVGLECGAGTSDESKFVASMLAEAASEQEMRVDGDFLGTGSTNLQGAGSEEAADGGPQRATAKREQGESTKQAGFRHSGADDGFDAKAAVPGAGADVPKPGVAVTVSRPQVCLTHTRRARTHDSCAGALQGGAAEPSVSKTWAWRQPHALCTPHSHCS